MRTVTDTLRKISPLTWLLGFITLLIYQALDNGLNNVLELLFRSPDGTPNWVWFVAALSVLINILFPVGISFWILASLRRQPGTGQDFQQLLIETLRVWGKILLYTLFFILPGLWKWSTSLFVPYVVLFSKKYQDGQVDAIKASAKVFKKTWGRTTIILAVFSVVIPLMITTSFDQYREIWVHPVGATLIGLAEYISIVVSLILLLNLYQKSSSEVDHELIF